MPFKSLQNDILRKKSTISNILGQLVDHLIDT
jgi:4-coumarate--CoA ligase